MPPTREPQIAEAGEVKAPQTRCELCGTVGHTVYDPNKAPPNRLCLRCAMEYGNSVGDYEDY